MSLVNRKSYPASEKYIYLNTPATGLISKELVAYRRRIDEELLIDSSVKRESIWEEMDEVKSSIHALINCDISRVALIPNFSYGINMLLPLLKDKKFLVMENEYPSLLWPLQMGDFDVSYAKNGSNMESNIEQTLKKSNAEVFIFSIVQFINGIQIDLSFIKSLKKRNPDLIIIADGTQFLGTDTFNFDESGIDVFALSAYKWMTAGFGNGFIAFSEQILERINPSSAGYNAFRKFGWDRETPKAFLFEPGHQALINFGSLGFAIKELQNIGLSNIKKHNLSLVKKAYEFLLPLGLVEESVVNRPTQSSIIVMKDKPGLFQSLKDANILAIQREGIRIGFHFYNNEEDVKALLSGLQT